MTNQNEIRSILYKLQNGKSGAERYLISYGDNMKKVSSQLSAVRFAMNYIVLCEMLCDAASEGKQIPSVIYRTANELSSCVKNWLDDEENGHLTAKIAKVKVSSTEIMRQLTNLADRYTICEYALNRKEYQFKTGGFPVGYSDEKFVNRILQFILGSQAGKQGESKQQMQMLRTVSVVEQLPIRMTKTKFSQLLHDGLTVYESSDKETLDNLLDMIRTTAGVSDIKASEEMFPFLYEILAELEENGLDHLKKKQFGTLFEKLHDGFDSLNDSITFMMIIQELINDLYVMGLCGRISDAQNEFCDLAEQIIGAVYDVLGEIKEQREPASSESMLQSVYDMTMELEGCQEQLYEVYALCDSALEELSEAYQDLITSDEELSEQMTVLVKISKLLSGSLYVELENEGSEKSVCDSAYIEECYSRLIKDLFTRFEQMGKSMKKAVMAKILAQLPPFLRTYDQLEQYISNSITGCDDLPEKLACVEIIEGMMQDE